MTPEALSAYLHKYPQFDPDAIQEVLVEYLTWSGPPIRYPKRWAWRKAFWRTQDHYRQLTIRGLRVGDYPLDSLVSPAPSPLAQVEQRQRLERFDTRMRASLRPSHQARWNLFAQRDV